MINKVSETLLRAQKILESNRLTVLRARETPWSAREIASVALLVERKRSTENVLHMLLSDSY